MITKEQLLIQPKRIVEKHLRFRIPTGLTPNMFGDLCTWEELLNVKGPLPTDIFNGISWDDDESDIDYDDVLVLVVIRKQEETDEEYTKRIKEKASYEKIKEDDEKREYERLKLKYS